MNMKKINKFILDEFGKSDGTTLQVGEYEDKIFVSNGFVGFLIDKDKFIFDTDKITTRMKMREAHIKGIFEDINHVDAPVSGEIKLVGKSEMIGISAEDQKTTAYVNRKYLNFFDKAHTYKINGKANPIIVYEEDKAIAVIVPVRV